MKYYYLELSNNDLTSSVDDNGRYLYTSDIVDLYDNDSYKNYSVTKSIYGLDTLEDGTWTGLSYIDDTPGSEITDSGFISNGRFVDTSGRIDLTTYKVTFENRTGTGRLDYRLNLYTDTIGGETDLSLFSKKEFIVNNTSYIMYDTPQNVAFELVIDTEEFIDDLNFTLCVLVAIDQPVIVPKYESTKRIAYKFPSWTDIHEEAGYDEASPWALDRQPLATPTTVGGSFINAISGEWLDELESIISRYGVEQFINTADVDQLATVYESVIPVDVTPITILGDGEQITSCASLYELYYSTQGPRIYWDGKSSLVYTTDLYDELSIDGNIVEQTPVAVWNWFDEFGLLVDLVRLKGESNERFKGRILDVYKNIPGVTFNRFTSAVRRELDLWYEAGATPDSFFTPPSRDTSIINYSEDFSYSSTGLSSGTTIKNTTIDGVINGEVVTTSTWLGSASPTIVDLKSNGTTGIRAIAGSQTGNRNSNWFFLEEKPRPGVSRELTVSFTVDNIEAVNLGTITSHPAMEVYIATEDGSWSVTFGVGQYVDNSTLTVYWGVTDSYGSSSYEENIDWPDSTVEIKLLLGGVLGDNMAIYVNDIQVGAVVPSNVENTTYFHSFYDIAINELDITQYPAVTGSGPYTVVAPLYTLTNLEITGVLAGVDELATPDFYFSAATPLVLEMSDLLKDTQGATPYMHDDGLPTERFTQLTKSLRKQFPILWGDFIWGNSIWDITGVDNAAIGYLPMRYDTDPVTGDLYQPGIGDGDDLKLYKPQLPEGPLTFDADITVKGKVKSYREEYPEVTLSFDVYAQGTRNEYTYTPVTQDCYLSFYVDGGDIHYYNFTLTASSDIFFDQATPSDNSIAFPEGLGISGDFEIGTTIYDSSGNPIIITTENQDDYNLNAALESATPNDIVWGFGSFNTNTLVVDAATPSDDIRASWSDQEFGTVVSGTYDNNRSTGTPFALPVMINYKYSVTSATWVSAEKMPFTITLNGAGDDESQENETVVFPDFVWPYGVNEASKRYKVVVTSTDGFADNPAGSYYSSDNTTKFLPIANISVNGNASWTSGVKILTYTTKSYEFATTSCVSPVYPEPDTMAYVWDDFEETIPAAVSGIVDIEGIWKDGVPPQNGSNNTNLQSLSLTRSDFSLSPTSTDYFINWIGVTSGNDFVDVWLDTNTVQSDAAGTEYIFPENPAAIQELYDEDNSTYYLTPFTVKARLKRSIDPHWYPQMHSGYVYLGEEEYYHYVDPATAIVDTATAQVAQARQGAPIIVRLDDTIPMRQVAFHDATPSLTLVNTETVFGTDGYGLYASYDDLYDVEVFNVTDGIAVTCDATTVTNYVTTATKTDPSKEYEITYTLTNSFYADSIVDEDGMEKTYIVFDKTAADNGGTNYSVKWENELIYPARNIDLPLNPSYTTIEESFIYLSSSDYAFGSIEFKLNKPRVIGRSDEYALLTIKTFDINKNPKANVAVSLTTDFGSFEDASLTTDKDGFCCTVFYFEDASPTDTFATVGVELPDESFVEEISIPIVGASSSKYSLLAVPTHETVQADGQSHVSIDGAVLDENGKPRPYAVVKYRKARSIKQGFDLAYSSTVIPEMATPSWGTAGKTVANSAGRFTLGPFVSATPDEPGYWFVILESQGATPIGLGGATPGTDTATPWDTAGDVVFWYEYPEVLYGSELLNKQQILPVNKYITRTPLAATPVFRSGYIEDATPEQATPLDWEPPKWYAINRYEQYLYGMLGDTRDSITYSLVDDFHPDFKEF